VRRHPVQRLDHTGTAALIAATLGEVDVSNEFANLIYGFAEVNPFFTLEVVQTLVERGDIVRSAERWQRRDVSEIEVPESVKSAIAERLSRLSDETKDVLRGASVLGQSFAFEPLQTIENRGAEAIEAALEEAAGAGIVRITGDDTYEFNQQQTCTVPQAIPIIWRAPWRKWLACISVGERRRRARSSRGGAS